MADTKIEWTDATWNPVRGCSRVSQGCMNCYAEHQALRITRFDRAKGVPEGQGAYDGLVTLTSQGPKWTGAIRTVPDKLEEPLGWKKPKRIFVNSMSDLFHESVPDEFVDQVFAVMGACDDAGLGHTFQVLTKRPGRMLRYMRDRGHAAWNSRRLGMEAYPPRNVHLGVSVEDQSTAEDRIPLLLATPARVRFISAEPLLAPIDLTRLHNAGPMHGPTAFINALRGGTYGMVRETGERMRITHSPLERLDWVIVGGESGRGARLVKQDWVRSLRDQCAAEGVPFFFKQWGGADKKESGRLLDGVTHDAYPRPQREEADSDA